MQLDAAIRRVREAHVGDSHGDREALEDALAHFERALTDAGETVRAPGWVSYTTASGVRLAERLPVRTSLAVSWQIGAQVAPLIEEFKELRPAIVALVDSLASRRARVY